MKPADTHYLLNFFPNAWPRQKFTRNNIIKPGPTRCCYWTKVVLDLSPLRILVICTMSWETECRTMTDKKLVWGRSIAPTCLRVMEEVDWKIASINVIRMRRVYKLGKDRPTGRSYMKFLGFCELIITTLYYPKDLFYVSTFKFSREWLLWRTKTTTKIWSSTKVTRHDCKMISIWSLRFTQISLFPLTSRRMRSIALWITMVILTTNTYLEPQCFSSFRQRIWLSHISRVLYHFVHFLYAPSGGSFLVTVSLGHALIFLNAIDWRQYSLTRPFVRVVTFMSSTNKSHLWNNYASKAINFQE